MERFQQQWFAIVLLGASALAIYHGLRIGLRGELDNPLLTLRGGRAVALGLALPGLGIAGAAMAVRELGGRG